jgi:glycosyltransferase involved in cell wall biosynthesis
MSRLAVFLATSGHSGVDRVMGNLLPAIARLGVEVDLLKVDRHGPELRDLPEGLSVVPLGCAHVGAALPALARYLRRQRPDALLCDKDRVNRTGLLALWLARVPTRIYLRMGTTVSVNLASRSALDRWRQRFSIRHLYPRATGLLVPSRGAAEDLARVMGRGGERIHVVPSPVVRPDIAALAKEPIEDGWLERSEAPLILGVGELSGRKDYATVLRAFARVRARRACRLAILGEGRRRAELETLAGQLGLAGEVHLPGFVNNPYPWIRCAALFAHGARWEGMPVVLVEALALGTPVVSTDCPSGPRELLDDGRLGRLVPVGDAEAMAEAMLETLARPPEAALLRQSVEAYRVDRSAGAYLDAMGFSGHG